MDVKHFYDDLWRSEEKVKEDQTLQEMRRSALEYSYSLLGDIRDKKLLEIGCGAGFQTINFAEGGASVTSIDFSQAGVDCLKCLLKEKKLNAEVKVMDAENMDFEDAAFDLVYINSVLMHVNKERVINECSRVLKSGGKLVVIEPLRYNILLPYRMLFSPYRKTRPRYVTVKALEKHSSLFSDMVHKEFYFFSILMLPFFGKNYRVLGHVRKLLENADAKLSKLPMLNNFCWVVVACYYK